MAGECQGEQSGGCEKKNEPGRKRHKARRSPRTPPPLDGSQTYYELEVIPGLAELAQAELLEHGGAEVRLLPSARKDRCRFQYAGRPKELLGLRRPVAVSRVVHLNIPRPKALLGHQYFETLFGVIQEVLALHEPGSFQTFHISAAGSNSPVFLRIKSEIQSRSGLHSVEEVGDLLLAVRRPHRLAANSHGADAGWEVAVRLSPRPLSARSWRVCDMPGALNGAVASTMMSLTRPSGQDCVINLACGSGTLLIERLALGPVRGAVGCDIDAGALACARKNLIAAGSASGVTLIECDAVRTPLPDGWGTTACVDLPFGMLVGAQESNELLYPRLLAEAGRLLAGGGRLVAITQEVKLFERTLAAQADLWKVMRSVRIKLSTNIPSGYIHPRIYLLHRSGNARQTSWATRS